MKTAVIAVAVLIALAFGIWQAAKRDAAHDDLRDQVKAQERINGTLDDIRSRDDDGILGWLLERAGQ